MKQELSEYIPSKIPDPKPSELHRCHSKPITCIEYILPEDFDEKDFDEQKKLIKYATGSQDGTVRVWNKDREPEK